MAIVPTLFASGSIAGVLALASYPVWLWRLGRPNAAAVATAELLDLCPNEWAMDGHCYLRHESGLTIWVANRAYALAVHGPEGEAHGFRQCLGGNASQNHVWRAYKRWLAKQPVPLDPTLVLAEQALASCLAHHEAGGR